MAFRSAFPQFRFCASVISSSRAVSSIPCLLRYPPFAVTPHNPLHLTQLDVKCNYRTFCSTGTEDKSNMPLTVYGIYPSPPFRSVLITAKFLGIPYDVKEVNIIKGEHHYPEFLKLNPLHTIPTIDDDGFVLFESHAICLYLIEKYAKDEKLYPKDIQKRAIINQRLFFDSSNLFPKLLEAAKVIFSGSKTLPEDILTRTSKTLTEFEALLGDSDWAAQTPQFSIADICILTSLENMTVAIAGAVEGHPKVVAYMERAQAAIPRAKELAIPGLKGLREIFGFEPKDVKMF